MEICSGVDSGTKTALILENNDECITELIDKAGYEAALTIDILKKRLDFEAKVLVSYSGVVFKLGKIELVKRTILNSNN